MDLPLVTRSVKIWRDGHLVDEHAAIAREEPLVIVVNGQQVAALMRLPGDERELAAGFLISEGIVSDFSAIHTITHCADDPAILAKDALPDNLSRNRVDVRAEPQSFHAGTELDILRLVRSGCGAVQINSFELHHPPLGSQAFIKAEILVQAAKDIRSRQAIHSQAGGTHVAGVYKNTGECIVIREDIGRHNAVDKVCGYCLLNAVTLSDKLLLCSGRLSYEMVNKALNLGIEIIASLSAPTELALQLAEAGNITVIGYLRGSRMTAYTYPERILFPADGTEI